MGCLEELWDQDALLPRYSDDLKGTENFTLRMVWGAGSRESHDAHVSSRIDSFDWSIKRSGDSAIPYFMPFSGHKSMEALFEG